MVFLALTRPSPNGSQVTGTASLVATTKAVAPNSVLKLGVYLQPSKGWHTYWFNPGDSGGPTTVNLQLPKGWSQGPVEFPTPKRLDLSGVVSYGYETPQLLIIPVRIPARLEKSDYRITASVKWLTCTSEVCKPANQTISLVVHVGAPAATKWIKLFRKTEASLPAASNSSVAVVRRSRSGFELSVSGIKRLRNSSDFYFFPSKTGLVDHSKPQHFSWKGGNLIGILPGSPYAQGNATKLVGVLASGESGEADQSRSLIINAPIQP